MHHKPHTVLPTVAHHRHCSASQASHCSANCRSSPTLQCITSLILFCQLSLITDTAVHHKPHTVLPTVTHHRHCSASQASHCSANCRSSLTLQRSRGHGRGVDNVLTETALHTITCDICPLTHSQADGAHSTGHSRGVVCFFVCWLVGC